METVNCNLCNSDNYKRLYHIQGVNIVQCNNCGLIYVNPRPSEDELGQLYTKAYYTSQTATGYHDYLESGGTIMNSYRPRLETIEKYKRSGRLLEIGCASGFFLELARERGWQTQGVDISLYATTYARKVLGIDCFTGTLQSANFQKEYFDVVAMWDTLMHLPDPVGTLVEVNRILRQGGVLAMDALNMTCLNVKLFGKHWSVLQKTQEHLYYFSANTIRKLLDKTGFEVIEIQTLPHPISLRDVPPKFCKKPFSLISFLLWKIGINSKDEHVVYARVKK